MKVEIKNYWIKCLEFKNVCKYGNSTQTMVVEKVETGNKMEDYDNPVSVYTYSKNDNGVLEEVKMFLDREEVKALRDFFDQILREQAPKVV